MAPQAQSSGVPCFFHENLEFTLEGLSSPESRIDSICVYAAPKNAVAIRYLSGGSTGQTKSSGNYDFDKEDKAKENGTGETSMLSTGAFGDRGSDAVEESSLRRMEDDRLTLFVGMSDGTLLVYDAKSSSDSCEDLSMSFRLRSSIKRFNPSKRGIKQLTAVDKWGLLLSILDGQINVHSLHELSSSGTPVQLDALDAGHHVPFDIIRKEFETASDSLVSTYSLNVENDAVAAVCKSWILIIRFKKPISFAVVNKIFCPDNAVAIHWVNNIHLYAGFQKDYVIYDILSGNEVKRPRLRTGLRKQPVMASIMRPPDAPSVFVKKEQLLCKDTEGYFLDSNGLPSRTTAINWLEPPVAILSCPPFIIGLLSSCIQIHMADTCTLMQSIPLRGRKFFATNANDRCFNLGSNAPIGDGASSVVKESLSGTAAAFNVLAMTRALVFVADEKRVDLLVLSPLPQIVDDLLASEYQTGFSKEIDFNLALEICASVSRYILKGELLSPAAWVQPLTGIGLTPSESELLEATTRARHAIYYLTDIAPEVDYKLALTELEASRASGRLPFEFVTTLFKRTNLFDSVNVATTVSLNLSDLRSELSELYRHVVQVNGPIFVQASGDYYSKVVKLVSAATRLALNVDTDELVQPLFSESATNLACLNVDNLSTPLLNVFLPFALQFRSDLLTFLETEWLFPISPGGSTSGTGPDEPMTSLTPSGKIKGMNQLYIGIVGIVEESLAIVDTILLRGFVLCTSKIQGNMEMRAKWSLMAETKIAFLRNKNWCYMPTCERLLLAFPEMQEDLLSLYFGKQMHEDALNWLYKLESNHGFFRDKSKKESPYAARAIEYIRCLGKPHQDIVLKHAKWIVQHCRPEDSILMFFSPNSLAGRKIQAEGLNESYPSFVSESLSSDENEADDGLDFKAVVCVLEELDREAIKKAVEEKKPIPTQLAPAYLSHYLASTFSSDTSMHGLLVHVFFRTIENLKSNFDSEKVTLQLHELLCSFLKESDGYLPAEVAPLFANSDFFEEYAIVLSRLGRHKDAIGIYANRLKSLKKALDYCSEVYDCSDPTRKQVYQILVEVLLEDGRVDDAIQVACTSAKNTDPLQILRLLPSDMSLSSVKPFLDARLYEQSRQFHNVQIIKQMMRKDHLEVRGTLLSLHRNYAMVSRDTVCANSKCGRPILAHQSFARLPNGVLVHHACL